jgi:N-carbamoylputrescine amidase
MAMREAKSENLATAERLIDRAANAYRPDIIGLPELFNTRYFPLRMNAEFFSLAESIRGESMRRMRDKAREHSVTIVAPFFEHDAGCYYDSSAVIGENGKILGVSRKLCLPLANWKQGPDSYNVTYEKFYFASGANAPIFRVKGFRVGQLICYDRHFPENWRILQLAGADLIFVPVASNGPVLGDIFVGEMRALAFMHQCYVAAVNRVGLEHGFSYYGGSHICDPYGRVLAGPAGKKEEVVCAEIEKRKVSEARRRVNFLRDRRPELYQDLVLRG